MLRKIILKRTAIAKLGLNPLINSIPSRYPITLLIRKLTLEAMALYPCIKTMALYLNENFEIECWKESLVTGKAKLTKSGNKKTCIVQNGHWIGNGCLDSCCIGWTILDGFRPCEYFDFDRSRDKLQSKLLDTIKSREMPHELVKIESIEDDEVEANNDKEMDKNEFSQI